MSYLISPGTRSNGALIKPSTNARVNWAHSISKGLVGCWLFNESNGKTLRNLALPGRGDASIPSSSVASLGASAKFGLGVSSGSSGSSSFAPQTADISELNCPNGYTLETWIYLNATGSACTIAGKGAGDVFNIWYDGTHFRTDLQHGNGIYDSCTSNTTPSAKTWYHLVGTWDGTVTSAAIKIYVNGKFEASVPCNVAPNSASGTGFFMAGGPDNANDPTVNGKLDFVRLWNRALSATEISQLYSQPFVNIQPNRYIVAAPTAVSGTNYPSTLSASVTSSSSRLLNAGKKISPTIAQVYNSIKSVSKSIKGTSTETPTVKKAATLPRSASLTTTGTLSRAINRLLALVTTALVSSATLLKNVAMTLFPHVFWSIASSKSVATTKSATSTSSVSQTKGVNITKSVAVTFVASLSYVMNYLKTISSSITSGATKTLTVLKSLVGTQGEAANSAKNLNVAKSTSLTSVGSLIRSIGKALTASLATNPSVVHGFGFIRNLAASLSVATTLNNVVGKALSTSVSLSVSALKAVGKQAQTIVSISLARTASVAKAILASTSVQASRTSDVEMSRSTSTSVTSSLSNSIGHTLATSASTIASKTISVAKGISASLVTLASLITQFGAGTVNYSKQLTASLATNSLVVKNVLVTKTVALIAQATRVLSANKNQSVSLAENAASSSAIGKLLGGSVASTAARTLSVAKKINFTVNLQSFFVKNITKPLASALASTVTLLKGQGFFKTLSSSLTAAPSLTKALVYSRIIQSSLSFSNSLTKAIAKGILSSLSNTSYIYKYININRITSIQLNSNLLKGFFYSLSSTIASTIAITYTKGLSLFLSATESLTSSGSRAIGKRIPVVLVTQTKAAFAIGKILRATVSSLGSILRGVLSAIIKLPAYSDLELQNDFESSIEEYLPAEMTLEEDSAAEMELIEIG